MHFYIYNTYDFCSGPANHFWQKFLEEYLFKKRTLNARVGAKISSPSASSATMHARVSPARKSILSDTTDVLKRVVVDQLTFGPICNMTILSYLTFVLNNDSKINKNNENMNIIGKNKNLFLEAKSFFSKFAIVQLNGWKMWPLAALISYSVVPIKYDIYKLKASSILH